MSVNSLLVPLVICGILLYGLAKKVDVYDAFLEGVKEGLHSILGIFPALVALMVCIGMFKASGALDALTHLLARPATVAGIPEEVIPLGVLRTLSGSGAMVLFTDLLATHGPDSFIGRVASVMEGSSETTFYTIAVYFGAVGIHRTRHTVPAALAADVACVVASVWMVRLLLT